MRARPVAAIALGALATPILLGLGLWQLQRDGERNAARDGAMAAAGLPELDAVPTSGGEWRAVRLTGHFAGEPALIPSPGELAGYHQLQRFEGAGGSALVDRGFVAAESAPLATPQADLALVGQIRPLTGDPATRPLPSNHPGASAWPVGASAAVHDALAPEAPPIVIVSGPAEIPPRDDTSRWYAAQWFTLAGGSALVAVVGVVRALAQREHQPADHRDRQRQHERGRDAVSERAAPALEAHRAGEHPGGGHHT